MVSRTHAIEILSILITSVVLGYIGLVAGIQLVAVDTPPAGAMTVKVIARQFYWTFQYPNGSSITYPNGTTLYYPKGLTIDNYFYLKVGQSVQFEVISLDVAHSFFIPELGIHIDAIPGHVNHAWLRVDSPGTYQIICTQFCGTGHYKMIGHLIATP